LSFLRRLDRRRWRELNPSVGYLQQKSSTFFKSLKNQRKP
jgi:hypothetical protein